MKDRYANNRSVKTGHYVGLKFDDGWFFVNVIETESLELKPYILQNKDNERAAIPAGEAGSQDDNIIDEVRRQLVEPDGNEQDLIFQILVGVAPSRMQIYPFFGRDRAPNLGGGAEPGSPQVPLSGYDSPYNSPTLQGEMFTVNDMEDLQLQAYNPMREAKEARLSIYVTKFKYTVVEDTDLMRSFIDGQTPFRDHAMGLGAQSNDQIRAPGWMMDRFSDVILTTREIYEETEPQVGGGSSDAEDVIPDANMG